MNYIAAKLLIFSATISSLIAQNSLGINNENPSNKAALDVKGSYAAGQFQGILIPRYNNNVNTSFGLSGTNNVGLTYYDTLNQVFRYYAGGGVWMSYGGLGSVASPWTENAGSLFPSTLTNQVGIGTALPDLGYMLTVNSTGSFGGIVSNSLSGQAGVFTTTSQFGSAIFARNNYNSGDAIALDLGGHLRIQNNLGQIIANGHRDNTYKMQIVNNGAGGGMLFPATVGINAIATDNDNNAVHAIQAYSENTTANGSSFAMVGIANGNAYNTAISAEAIGIGIANKGIEAHAANSNDNYGADVAADGANARNYALMARANGSTADNYGIYATASGGNLNFSGYFASGDVFINDNLGIGTVATDRLAVDGAIALSNMASAPAPAVGVGKLYAKADNNLYYKKTDGTEYLLNGGGGLSGTGSTNMVPFWTGTSSLGFTNLQYTLGSFGIGVAPSPSYLLQAQGSNLNALFYLNSQSAAPALWAYNSFVGGTALRTQATGPNGYAGIFMGGNVGIGAITPIDALHIYKNPNPAIRLEDDNNACLIQGGTDLVFITNTNNERVRIMEGTGNVGIGTSSPTALLTVSRSNAASNGIDGTFIDITNAQTALNNMTGIRLKTYGVSGGYAKGGIFFQNTSGAGANGLGSIIFANNNFPDATNARISDAVMAITSDKFVGIGTTTPIQTFHVASENLGGSFNSIFEGHSATTTRGPGISVRRSKGTITTPVAVVNGDYLGGMIFSGFTGSAYNLSSSIQAWVDAAVSGTSVPGSLRFYTTSVGASTTSEKMRINSEGNVGIGTITPTSNLHVVGNPNINIPIVTINHTSSGSASFFTNGTNSFSISPIGTGGKYMYFNHPSGPITILGSNGVNGWLGTSSNHGLNFTTNSAVQMTLTNTGDLGIGCTAPAAKLHVNGAIRSTLMINTAALACSDFRYKKNICSIVNPLQLVKNLSGKTYYWKVEDFPEWQFSDGMQYGFIAQEIEKVLPSVVVTDSSENKYKAVDYSRLTPILVEAVKEQQHMIDSLKQNNFKLDLQLQQLKGELNEQKNENEEIKNMKGELDILRQELQLLRRMTIGEAKKD